MNFFCVCGLALSLAALLCASASAQETSLFTSPLPTGVRLDPAGEAVDLGSLPINPVLAPEKDRAVVVLSGWREQGVQVVDLKTRRVTQTLLQDGAFLRRLLLARRSSPLCLRRQHRRTFRLRMERRCRHPRKQVRTGEGKN